MKHISRLLIVLTTLTSGILHRTACAATTARLGVSAIVETRCAIKVTPGSGKQKSAILNNCSDNTIATVTIAPDTVRPASSDTGSNGASSGIGNADITITY